MFKGFLRLWPFVQPYRWTFVSTIVLSVLLALFAPLLAVLGKILIDALNKVDFIATYPFVIEPASRLFGEENVRYFLSDSFLVIKVVAICFPIYYFLNGIIRYSYYYQLRYMEERITNEVRYSIMDRMMRLSPSYFLNNTSGSGGLLSRTLNDTMVIQMGLQFYSDMMREPIIAVASVAYMFYVNWKISLFCLIFLPLFAYIIRTMTKVLRSLAHRSMDALELVTKTLKEGLDGTRVIQSFNLEDHMRRRFRLSIDNYNHIRKKVIKRMEITSPLNEFLASILVCAVVIWVGQMIAAEEMAVSDFISFLIAAAGLDKPIKKIQQSIVQVQPTTAAIERVFSVIESTESVKEIQNPLPLPKNWQTIEFKNVSFAYGDAQVLKDFSLTVKRGEIIALVGESGSGKSTLVNLLERFFDPSQGEILIDGISIHKFRVKELRDQIALVTQDVFLFDASIEENIRAGDGRKAFSEVLKAAEKANAMRFIESLPQQFQSRAGERGANFSGGEKQRLSIARAIYKDAPILILDEATSALDSASEAEVQKGIQSLMQGRTAFVVAHRLSTIASANRILVLSKGEIVEQGTHMDLLSKGGLYKHYHTLQVDMRQESE